MWQSGEFLNVFNTFTLKQIFLKRKTFSKKLEYLFFSWKHLVKRHHFHTKLPYQKPMLRQIECWVQNGPITKKGVLPITTLFFSKFCFSWRTSHKELIWYTKDPNVHIHTLCKRWSFIWQCFFPVSILNVRSSTY